MNLITNASEAIDDKVGIINLSTGLNEFSHATLNGSRLEEKLPPGRYVWMKVCDSGCGMDGDTLHKLFDPFFTTKFTGRGLGMSAVLGIMRAHNGAFMVDSKPGIGTTIQVLFPIAISIKSDITFDSIATNETETADSRSGIILLVDDEKMIREVTVAMLHELGYESLTAADGREALRLFREHGEGIGLVLLDQIMPGMDGVEVFKELRLIRPDINVLLASGYSELEMAERFKGLGLRGFIQKPYNLEQLADEIRRAYKVA
jgi:CheY-like chemotaxis protein